MYQCTFINNFLHQQLFLLLMKFSENCFKIVLNNSKSNNLTEKSLVLRYKQNPSCYILNQSIISLGFVLLLWNIFFFSCFQFRWPDKSSNHKRKTVFLTLFSELREMYASLFGTLSRSFTCNLSFFTTEPVFSRILFLHTCNTLPLLSLNLLLVSVSKLLLLSLLWNLVPHLQIMPLTW